MAVLLILVICLSWRDNGAASPDPDQGARFPLRARQSMKSGIPPMCWSEKHAAGHPGMDAQHQVLSGLQEQTRLRVASARPGDYRQIILDLLKYVTEHCSYGYRLMCQRDYPALEEHHRRHRELTLPSVALKNAVFAGKDAGADPMIFLAGWIQDHIGRDDVRLANHLMEHGAT